MVSIRKRNAPLTERNKFDGSVLEAVTWLKKQKDVTDLVVSLYTPTEYIPVPAFLNHYSMFYAMDPNTERYNEILAIIKTAFDVHDEHCCTNCYGGPDAPSIDTLAENAAKAILGSIG